MKLINLFKKPLKGNIKSEIKDNALKNKETVKTKTTENINNNINTKIEEYKKFTLSPAEYFYMHDGQIIKNPVELPSILEILDDETFKYHVTDQKNDFSNWIKGVFRDKELSDKLANVKTKQETISVINNYLNKNTQDNLPNNNQNNTQIKIQNKIKEDNIQKPEQAEAPVKKEPPKTMDTKDFNNKVKQVQERIKQVQFNGEDYHQINDSSELVKKFNEDYQQLKNKVSEIRKKGYDTKICELHLMRIPPKIKIFEITKTDKEADRIKKLFQELCQETNSVINSNPIPENETANSEKTTKQEDTNNSN
ncbi:hypothetical protein JXB41_03705 [Candidatus Woesearchaeota archaeon]|nr:hypothetical protein [Candidatus Woesearchaeota archaeon]